MVSPSDEWMESVRPVKIYPISRHVWWVTYPRQQYSSEVHFACGFIVLKQHSILFVRKYFSCYMSGFTFPRRAARGGGLRHAACGARRILNLIFLWLLQILKRNINGDSHIDFNALTLFPMGGAISPPSRKSTVFGRKIENFQKWTVGKCPPHSPQPHLNPTISFYIR